jgi:hypothetical protein
VLTTLASTNGDFERTAKMLGMSIDEVRRDLQALLDGNDGDDAGDTDGNNGKHPKPTDTPARPSGAVKKPVAKKK